MQKAANRTYTVHRLSTMIGTQVFLPVCKLPPHTQNCTMLTERVTEHIYLCDTVEMLQASYCPPNSERPIGKLSFADFQSTKHRTIEVPTSRYSWHKRSVRTLRFSSKELSLITAKHESFSIELCMLT